MLHTARSHIGLVRHMNQDGFAVQFEIEPKKLVLVADGMGGASAGEIASQLAVKTVTDYILQRIVTSEDVEQLLRGAIYDANQQICTTAASNQEYEGMGTTVVVAVLDQNTGYVGHVGDSRAYICRETGLEQLTSDHSLVAELVRRGQITEQEAEVHPHRHLVTRSLGTVDFSTPDVLQFNWIEGDVLLLCTDGLSNCVHAVELEQYLRQLRRAQSEVEVERIADGLLRLALERGGPDNITFVIVVNRKGGDSA